MSKKVDKNKSSSKKITAAVIIDCNKIPLWSFQSLVNIKNLVDIRIILNCKNTFIKKNIFKNFIYYLINYFSIRSSISKKIPFNSSILSSSKIKIINFNSIYDGAWQKIPEVIYNELIEKNIDLIIKFGMNLLKVPEKIPIRYGIVSFHHGDPAKYKGRPAGFYELYNNEKSMGVIVQKINNRIDSGEILAQLESKVYKYSYKKTIYEAYENSIFLLNKAIVNIINETKLDHNSIGKNYRLPNNYIATKFIIKIIKNKMFRILYGMFFEKKWMVAISSNAHLFSFLKKNNHISENILSVDKMKYFFYADPFWINDNSILVEALSKKSLKGKIIKIDGLKTENISQQVLINYNKHFSYPCVFLQNNNHYVLPEMCNMGNQKLFLIKNGGIKSFNINGLNDIRIIDPTYCFINNTHYIFGSLTENSWGRLYIWYSKESFMGKYIPHPNNPVKISPNGSRMAGSIIKFKNKIYRLGQDNSDHYGNGVYLFEIIELNENDYKEEEILYKRFENRKGPHTINVNINSNQIVYDFYFNKFNPLAGINRIISKK